MSAPTCTVARFTDLDPLTLYALLRLRQDVFVVEQACAYGDIDGRDVEFGTVHVLLLDDGALLGYARVLDDGAHWRIGRVVLQPAARGRGLADLVMTEALTQCRDLPIVLDAQVALAEWYATFGFVATGPAFLDDGIPHVPMRRPAD